MKPKTLLRIASYTAADEFRSRGFLVLTIISIAALVLLRGCFSGEVVVNGDKLNPAELGWHASFIAFYFISVVGMLMAVLISMRLFRHERENGSAVAILSGPVNRTEYLLGRSLGVWILSSVFMLVLHFTVFLIVLITVHARIPGFLLASFISTIAVLFLTQLVLALSLFTSDILSALVGIVVIVVSFISDSLYMVMRSDLAKQLIQNASEANVAIWRVLWPKVGALQLYAVSIMQKNEFHSMGPVHPVFNLLIYVALLTVLLSWKFRREEIR